MKTAIVYASVHHGNTKKIVDAIAASSEVELIDSTQVKEKDLSGYDWVGFASGIYYGRFHQPVLNFASVNLPADKKIFLICTNGGNASWKSMEEIAAAKKATIIDRFACKRYDTFGHSNW